MARARRSSRSSIRPPSTRAPARPAFTLIETALATVIIGVGVVAIVEAQQGLMKSNNWSSQAATAAFLGNEVRELTRRLPRHDPVTGLYQADDGKGGKLLQGWGAEPNEKAIADFDDIDDFDGLKFGSTGDFPGPIDASGAVVPQTLPDGTILLDEDKHPIPLEGWSQSVTVEKVDPLNFATVLAHDYKEDADPNKDWRDVDDFPLRVTVAVSFQGPYDNAPKEVTRVVWIVP